MQLFDLTQPTHKASAGFDVLTHQEDPFVGLERMAEGCAHCLAIRELDRAHPATTMLEGIV
jgi:hypothetical protein